MLEAMDLHRGRKPVAEVWTDAGWLNRTEWLVVLPTWFPHTTRLVVVQNARDGSITMTITGFDVVDIEDGA